MEFINIRNRTNKICKQNILRNGYYVVSELNVFLQSGCYISPLGLNIVDWLVNEVKKWENKMNFFLKNTKIDIIMTGEDEEQFKKTKICWFCEKDTNCNKVRADCHSTVSYMKIVV